MAWQEPEAYRSLAKIDRAGMMWEWLRRDPGYVEWHGVASKLTSGAAIQADQAWGLHFRRGSSHRGA
jgi:hypothetical protein